MTSSVVYPNGVWELIVSYLVGPPAFPEFVENAFNRFYFLYPIGDETNNYENDAIPRYYIHPSHDFKHLFYYRIPWVTRINWSTTYVDVVGFYVPLDFYKKTKKTNYPWLMAGYYGAKFYDSRISCHCWLTEIKKCKIKYKFATAKGGPITLVNTDSSDERAFLEIRCNLKTIPGNPVLVIKERKMQIHFVDLNEDFINIVKTNGYTGFNTDVIDYYKSKNTPDTFYVSPANSLCFMDGGIDKAYMTLFPGIQERVKANVETLGFQSLLGRSYLPIGKAIVTDQIITSPSMLLPQNISSVPQNVKYCIHAAIKAAPSHCKVLVVPGIGCGYGKITPAKSFQQIKEGLTCPTIPNLRDILFQQPKVYMNREWNDSIM
jgi:O-acetyl-ADP-ribose deacetylase (regulator of RNase III)